MMECCSSGGVIEYCRDDAVIDVVLMLVLQKVVMLCEWKGKLEVKLLLHYKQRNCHLNINHGHLLVLP